MKKRRKLNKEEKLTDTHSHIEKKNDHIENDLRDVFFLTSIKTSHFTY